MSKISSILVASATPRGAGHAIARAAGLAAQRGAYLRLLNRVSSSPSHERASGSRGARSRVDVENAEQRTADQGTCGVRWLDAVRAGHEQEPFEDFRQR